ncbi:MAG: hypothetical protein IT299_05740 [Dehalococcoidia bacterium]|nr:hypothetical protein [Dehalococcoidia bacterium]
MRRLAVYGWSDATPTLLVALRERAGFEAVAIGDERPAALVRARAATGLPGFQHVREMARKADCDAVLVGDGALAAEVAEAAAARGAALLLAGGSAGADVLERAAVAAERHGVELRVLRPWLRSAAATEVVARLEGRTPSLLTIEASGPNAPMHRMRDLIALAARLVGSRVTDLSATQAGDPFEGAPLVAHLRLAEGRVAVLTVRMALRPVLRVLASDENGTLEVRAREQLIEIEEHRATGNASQESRQLPAESPQAWLVAEAGRIAEADATDLTLARSEAATLRAIEHALGGSFAEAVDISPRPFQVLRGGGLSSTRRSDRVTTGISLVPST